jgi:heterodisulfide reductase subunit C/quinone-modifying oxidoreductase subunit QmoC
MVIRRIVKFEAERDPDFANWVTRMAGGERIRHCLQCGQCSGTCPLSLYMDHTPRQLMYLAREGFKEEVLTSSAIWMCTSCYACMVKCPKNINITHLLYAFKERAITERRYPKRFTLAVLARQFARMVNKSGRVTESRLMIKVCLRTTMVRILGLTGIGWGLLRTGRMGFGNEHIEGRADLVKIIESVRNTRKELAL